VVSPLYYIMALALLGMSVVSFRYNRILFAMELTASVLLIIAVAVSDIKMRLSISRAAKNAHKVFTQEGSQMLEKFPLPAVIIADQGDVVWGNIAFRENICGEEGFAGDSILKYVYPKTLRQIMGESGTAVSYKNRKYTVYGARTEQGFLLYFIDDTEFKAIAKEYTEKKPVVCIGAFDNREEISRGGASGEESRMVGEVDAIVRDWSIQEMGGFVKKLNDGKYLILTDESHIEHAKQKRFQVLDRVRAVKSLNKMSATMSLGIGRQTDDLAESERKARQALDMALGRGGDQVAVMQSGDAFEFFGGLSKGVEKRDKVRTRVIAAAMSDNIKVSDCVFIMGHKNSDLDSVGSAIGMWAVIRKGLEKHAKIVVNEQQTLAGQLVKSVRSAYPNDDPFISPQEAESMATEKSVLIVVDTHSVNFVESRALLDLIPKIIVIDHHRMMVTHIKNSLIFYHEPYASSASEMVAEIVQYIRSSALDAIDAQALLAGIMLDTKNFVMKTGVRTFEAAAFLRRCGADTVEVKRLFSDTLDTYKEKAQLVSGAEVYKNCAIAVSNWDFQNMRIAAAQAADELLSIQGVLASFVLYRTGNGVNISGRSLGDVNVQVILEAFGGGGHFTMAGAQISEITIGEVKRLLIRELDRKLVDLPVED
jgi:Predicted signaling protein consisting of a modified GGDEF domain and a DHH domain